MLEYKLHIPNLSFENPLADLIIELESLRRKIVEGTTHPLVFAQVKQIFHTMESIGSSRIEGNNTTVSKYIDNTKINNLTVPFDEGVNEILNIEKAALFIEETYKNNPVNIAYIKYLHTLVVKGLTVEGDRNAGNFRKDNVKITGAEHTPPDFMQVAPLMEELSDFINSAAPPKYDLLKIALAHHRFVWIHPFGNGNGRVVRLFTYALLLKNVFGNQLQRIINPTAVFCSDRQKYYDNLAIADRGDDESLLHWAEYMLTGLKAEIEKLDHLTDYEYLKNRIMIPALKDALIRKYLNEDEFVILNVAVNNITQELQAADIKKAYHNEKKPSEISRMIKTLLEKKMLIPIREGSRKYVISFGNNELLQSMLMQLDKRGFLPVRNSAE